MEIAFSTGSLYGFPLAFVFRLAAAAGCGAVEVVVTPEVLLRGGEWVGRLAARHGLRVAALHRSLLPLPGWRETPGGLCRLVGLARAAAAPLLTVHPPRRVRDLGEPRARAFRRRVAAGRAAAGGEVTLAVENLGRRGRGDATNPFLDPPTLVRLAAEMGLGVTLDTAHAASWGTDLLGVYRALSPRLVHVHLSDYRPRPAWLALRPLRNHFVEHQAPGTGRLPLSGFLRALARDGVRGAVSLEVGPVPLRACWPGGLRRRLAACVAYVREAVATGRTSQE